MAPRAATGDPVAEAPRLHDTFGIDTYVVAVSVLPEEEASLNAIASAGSGGARATATFVRNPADLVPALTSIIEADPHRACNAVDDDCDGAIDEGFAVGVACDDGGIGACLGTGATLCAAEELSVECKSRRPVSRRYRVLQRHGRRLRRSHRRRPHLHGYCTPTGAEVCNGVDDDCNGLVDETDPAAGTTCGESMGTCMPGAIRCVGGVLTCIGGTGPRTEVCNGLDDNCDGMTDEDAPCPAGSMCIEGACRRPCDPAASSPVRWASLWDADGTDGTYCLPTACGSCAQNEPCIATCVDPAPA